MGESTRTFDEGHPEIRSEPDLVVEGSLALATHPTATDEEYERFPAKAGPEPYAHHESYGKTEGAPSAPLSAHERMVLGRVLLELMFDLSEQYWGSRWLEGLDLRLWEVAHGAEGPEGTDLTPSAVVAAEPGDLLLLAELAGGWWTWEDGPVFVPLHQWRRSIEGVTEGEVYAGPQEFFERHAAKGATKPLPRRVTTSDEEAPPVGDAGTEGDGGAEGQAPQAGGSSEPAAAGSDGETENH